MEDLQGKIVVLDDDDSGADVQVRWTSHHNNKLQPTLALLTWPIRMPQQIQLWKRSGYMRWGGVVLIQTFNVRYVRCDVQED